MLKKIGYGLLILTLAGGCKSASNTPVNYNDNNSGRAMPQQTYWWEVK